MRRLAQSEGQTPEALMQLEHSSAPTENVQPLSSDRLRLVMENALRNNPNPGMTVKSQPFDKSWFILKERLSNLSGVQPVIQQMIESHVGNLERDRVEAKRREQEKLIAQGGPRAEEQHMGNPVGADWPPEKRVLKPTEKGKMQRDQPPFSDEEMWQEHYVPHHDRVPLGYEVQEPEININPDMAMEDKEGNLLDAQHVNDRTERVIQEPEDPAMGLIMGQLEGIVDKHLKLIEEAPNAEAKARRIQAFEEFRDGTMHDMLMASDARKKRKWKKMPWKPQPQLWDIGVDRNPDPKPELDLE